MTTLMSVVSPCLLVFISTFLSPVTVPEVKVSEQTPSDELARKMRHYSGRSEYMWGIFHEQTHLYPLILINQNQSERVWKEWLEVMHLYILMVFTKLK